VKDRDRKNLRVHLTLVSSLKRTMEALASGEHPDRAWSFHSFKMLACKYMQLLILAKETTELPDIFDTYDVENMSNISLVPNQQQTIFESVYTNLSLLETYLGADLGVDDQEIIAIRDFLEARLRSAIFETPENEKDIQNTIEQLLIGRGMQKGRDYDRERGRVKYSAKESVPDFNMLNVSLAIEVKLIKDTQRIGKIVDEISADIAAYSKEYRESLFVVYDLGYIRDEIEFRQDLEGSPNVSVVVIKH